MALTKDQILAADDLGLLEVKVKEWGGVVYLRVMTVAERDAHELEWLNNKEKGVANFRTKFLARCLCDEKGERLFTDEEVGKLSTKNAAVMNRLWDKAMRHNALTQEDVDELAGE